MPVGKIYHYAELWPLERGFLRTFSFKSSCISPDCYLFEYVILDDFKADDNELNKDMLGMLYPGYPWDEICKLYREAPRSQK